MVQCISSGDFLSRIASVSNSPNEAEHHESSHHPDEHTIAANGTNLGSLNATTEESNNSKRTALATSIDSIKENLFLRRDDLWNICPILLYQLAAPAETLERDGCLDPAAVPMLQHHHEGHSHGEEENRTWGTDKR